MDDESSLRRTLNLTLTTMGFAVCTQPTGEQAIECLRNEPFDAVLLDINMPGMGGMETCRVLRRQYPQLAILMLTVRQGRQDKVEALEAGADDYVVKPFDLPELVARVRAVLRRVRSRQDSTPAIRIGDLELNSQNRSLTKSGQPIHLTPNEFALLHGLMSHPDKLISHAHIFRTVWGQGGAEDCRRLRSLVRALRKKIEPNPGGPTYLVTEPGFGYRFRSAKRDT